MKPIIFYCHTPRIILLALMVFLSVLVVMSGCYTEDTADHQTDQDGEEITFKLDLEPAREQDLPVCPAPSEIRYVSQDILSPKTDPEPAARSPFIDPVFGTCVVRVTDRNTDPSADDPSTGLKNEYSRVQSFNADGTLILARGIEGTWYVYDAQTMLPYGEVPLNEEPRWDSQDPYLISYFEGTSLHSYHLIEGRRDFLHDFSLDFPDITLSLAWTRYEGSPSGDGSIYGLMVQDKNWNVVGFAVYNLITDKVVATRVFPGGVEVDSVTISPSGNYFLAYFDNYCPRDHLGSDDNPCGLMVYDQNLKNGRGLLRIVGHSDVAYLGSGSEVLVFQDIDTDYISMLNLASGEITPLLPIDFSQGSIGLHFSGRALEFPGWAIVSTYTGWAEARTWMDNQVFAIELKPGGRILRLAHTHSLVDENQEHDYWAEAHATVNQSFSKVLFTSNWGRSGTGEVEMYLILLPDDWVKFSNSE